MGGSKVGFPDASDTADLVEEDERSPNGCQFDTCSFELCNFTRLNFGESTFMRCGFPRSKLCRADLSHSVQTLMHAFQACDLDGALLPPGTTTASGIPTLDREFLNLNRLNTILMVLCLYFFAAHLSTQEMYEFALQSIGIRLP
jgi:uncharacterized protein YjbI with pentapeptide repeats